MRIILVSLMTVLIGIAIGAGVASFRVGMSPWNPTSDESVPAAKESKKATGPAAKVVVDETNYPFGSLDLQAEGTHDFVFSNKGDAPLVLTSGGTSCHCTMSTLPEKPIEPGESAKVTLNWKPTERPGPYEQTASILTNDPDQPKVVLSISGQITAAHRFAPFELVFSRIAAGETATAEATLFGYLAEPLKILGQSWENEATAQFFDVATEPLRDEEIKREPSATSGFLVKVTAKAGLALGQFHQGLVFETNVATSPTANLSIRGSVASDISIIGPGWDSDRDLINLGTVDRDAGIERRLMLLVRGPKRKEITFKQVSVAPDSLKVRLGDPVEISNGAVIQTPLLIEIPKGGRPANHLGSEQGKLGEIILETTHPDVPQLRILVRFAIEG